MNSKPHLLNNLPSPCQVSTSVKNSEGLPGLNICRFRKLLVFSSFTTSTKFGALLTKKFQVSKIWSCYVKQS